jgi:hypothetical protein
MKLHRYLPLLAIALIGAALARPALGDGARGEQLPAVDPSTPEAAPFETNIPPVGDAGEDDRPTNSDAALAHLRAVKQCAAEHGVTLPEPVANAEGVQLGWDGPPRLEAEAAIARCDPAASAP